MRPAPTASLPHTRGPKSAVNSQVRGVLTSRTTPTAPAMRPKFCSPCPRGCPAATLSCVASAMLMAIGLSSLVSACLSAPALRFHHLMGEEQPHEHQGEVVHH